MVGTNINFKGFQVAGCTVTSSTLNCLNWIPSTAGVTYFAEGGTGPQGGHTMYGEGSPVKFYWFDGRDLSDANIYPTDSYDKFVNAEVTLSLLSSGEMAPLIMSGLSLIALASTTLLF